MSCMFFPWLSIWTNGGPVLLLQMWRYLLSIQDWSALISFMYQGLAAQSNSSPLSTHVSSTWACFFGNLLFINCGLHFAVNFPIRHCNIGLSKLLYISENLPRSGASSFVRSQVQDILLGQRLYHFARYHPLPIIKSHITLPIIDQVRGSFLGLRFSFMAFCLFQRFLYFPTVRPTHFQQLRLKHPRLELFLKMNKVLFASTKHNMHPLPNIT